MADHNFNIKFKADPKIYLDENLFMPYYKAQIDLKVILDAQHDGRLWSENFVECVESELIEMILVKFKSEVTEFVKKAKPFSIHGPV